LAAVTDIAVLGAVLAVLFVWQRAAAEAADARAGRLRG
jgi:hypothetical protein